MEDLLSGQLDGLYTLNDLWSARLSGCACLSLSTCMYVCIYVCTYIYTHTNTCARASTRARAHTHTHTHTSRKERVHKMDEDVLAVGKKVLEANSYWKRTAREEKMERRAERWNPPNQ